MNMHDGSTLSAVFQATADAMVVVDSEGCIEAASPATESVFGCACERLLGQHIAMLIEQSPDPQVRDMSLTLTELPPEGEHLFLGVLHKSKLKTPKQEQEQRVLKSQKLESLGVLAGGIAHDFNNLLMSVLGNANLAADELDPKSPAQEYLQDIEQAAMQAASLCKQMLAYAGKGRFVMQPVCLTRVVEDMTAHLRALIIGATHLELMLDQDVPAVDADPLQMHQIIMNLVSNASEAIGLENGRITLSTGTTDLGQADLDRCFEEEAQPGHFVYVDVSDSGCGIPSHVTSRIFDPFFTTKLCGRGLGLSAVQGIIRSHRGAIRVCSTPGEGSAIRVLLPSSVAPVHQRPESLSADELWMQGTVLVVDDTKAVLTITRRMLERAGLRVKTADNGADALEYFKEHCRDVSVVVLDMTMPHMSGLEVFERLRVIDPKVSVVLASGYSEHGATSMFADQDLAGFLHKPYRQSDLLSMLQKVLTQS